MRHLGKVNGQHGIWCSASQGARWGKLTDAPLGIYDSMDAISGDPGIFGRVYVGFGGTGFVYGTPGVGAAGVCGWAHAFYFFHINRPQLKRILHSWLILNCTYYVVHVISGSLCIWACEWFTFFSQLWCCCYYFRFVSTRKKCQEILLSITHQHMPIIICRFFLYKCAQKIQ